MVATIATYSVQVALVISAAVVLAIAMRSHPASLRLSYWRLVVLLCVALPLLPAQMFGTRLPTAASEVITVVSDAVVRNAAAAPEQSWTWLSWILAGGLLLRAMWLAAGAFQLRTLRSGSIEASLGTEIDALRERLAPHAELRWHAQIGQPVTFGWRRPAILLPPAIRALSLEARLAVVCHELLHVARRDWLWLWLEEAVRTVFWFHPFMRWAISQVRLGREQTVDARVVALTGTRRAYMDAIIRFAGPQPAIGLGMPFAGRQHVVLRLKALGQEKIMSRTRIALTGMVLSLLLVGTSWSIATALPLPQQTPSGPDPFDASTPALTQPVTLRFSNASVAAILNTLGTISGIRITYETGFEDGRYSVEFRGTAPREALRQVLSDNDLTYRGVDEKTIVVSPQRGNAVARFRAPAPREPNAAAPAGQSGTLVGSARPGEPTATPTRRPLRVGRDIETRPRKIFEVQPIYPEDAKDAKVQGVVLLDVTVGTDGTVKSLRLLKSVPLLDQAAMDAVNQWQFEPALLNGVPVEVEVTITINFTLK